MRTRSRFPSISIVLALGLLLPALVVVHQGGARAQEAAPLSMWLDSTGGSETADCMVQTLIDPFNALGGTQVEAVLNANNWDATRIALAGGAGPDIIGTPGPAFAFELARAGQLLALDDIAVSQGWGELFVPWALDLGKVDGLLYSVPNEVETLVLYYNKTLFAEKGWAAPKTMAELTALATEIDAAGIIPFAHANQEWRPANEWYVGEFLTHVAGPEKVYAALTGTAKWTDPEFVDAITQLTKMQQDGWFMGGLDRYYTTTFADTNVALAAGEAAMKIEGTWWLQDAPLFFGEAAGNTAEWDWVPVPSTTGESRYSLGIGSTLSINAKTENPVAAAEFLSYYFSPEMQASLALTCGLSPAPVTIAPDLMTGLDPRYAAILGDMNASSEANNYGYTTWTFLPPKSDVYVYEEIEKVWAGDITVDQYLQGLQTLFDQEKAAGDVPPIPAR